MKTLLVISLMLALGGGSSLAHAKTTITGTAPAEVTAQPASDGTDWIFALPAIRLVIQSVDDPGPSFNVSSSGNGTVLFQISDVLVYGKDGKECPIFYGEDHPVLIAELRIIGRYVGPAATSSYRVYIPDPGEYEVVLSFTAKQADGKESLIKTPPMRITAKAAGK